MLAGILVHEHIGWLEITMIDARGVEILESSLGRTRASFERHGARSHPKRVATSMSLLFLVQSDLFANTA